MIDRNIQSNIRRFIQCGLLLVVYSHLAHAEEYFGRFPEEPSFTVKSGEDRPTFILNNDFSFMDPNGLNWVVPKATEVDGASIPQVAWSYIGGPMSGKFLHASIIHDYYCVLQNRTAHDTHRNFYYGMKAKGVSEWKAKLMYWAVVSFGPSWKLIRPAQHCMQTDSGIFCEYPKEPRLIAKQSISLEHLQPDQAKRAKEFFDLMASSLSESNGKVAPTVCRECAIIERPATLDDLDDIANGIVEKLGLEKRPQFMRDGGKVVMPMDTQ